MEIDINNYSNKPRIINLNTSKYIYLKSLTLEGIEEGIYHLQINRGDNLLITHNKKNEYYIITDLLYKEYIDYTYRDFLFFGENSDKNTIILKDTNCMNKQLSFSLKYYNDTWFKDVLILDKNVNLFIENKDHDYKLKNIKLFDFKNFKESYTDLQHTIVNYFGGHNDTVFLEEKLKEFIQSYKYDTTIPKSLKKESVKRLTTFINPYNVNNTPYSIDIEYRLKEILNTIEVI